MVVVMEERATEAQIEQVVARLVEMGMDVHRSTGVTRTVLGVVGSGHPDPGLIEMMEGVHEVLRISSPYKLASRTYKPEDTIVTVGDVRIGGDEVIVMAGPCSAETEKQVRTAAAAVRRAGAKIFRGGAFKPRSSPYSFQGLGEEGLRMLQDAAKAEGMALAAHIAIAVAAALKIDQCEEALDSRTAISQAVGVLMERFAIKPDQAFALLTRISSTQNVKLRDVAVELVRTRIVKNSIDLGEAQGWKDSRG